MPSADACSSEALDQRRRFRVVAASQILVTTRWDALGQWSVDVTRQAVAAGNWQSKSPN